MDSQTLDLQGDINEIRRRIVEVELASVNQNLLDEFGQDVLRQNLIISFDTWLERRKTPPIVNRLSSVDMQENKSHEYLRKIIPADNSDCVMTQLRHEADGCPKCFVRVDGTSFALKSKSDYDRLVDAVIREYASFKPKYLTVFHYNTTGDVTTDEYTPDKISSSFLDYKRCPAGRLTSLCSDETPLQAERINIVKPDVIDFYDPYSQMYEIFWEESPQFKNLVAKETEDDLNRFHETGLLCVIEIDGDFAGVIAATPGALHGLNGWCMRERIISKKYRGQKLGPAVLWKFLLEIPAEQNDMLYGMIAVTNQASIRSALILGRIDVGGIYKINLD